MSNILRYKSIVAVCLCFIFVFSFFAFTFQRSEAIATISLVAVPIIKLLIASGVTFLSVDAMLEVYNRMKGTDYYNTLTGNLLNMLDDVSDDLVSAWLFHDWAMEQPDPPGSGWPEWPELLLGTLCLEIAKSDGVFQDFLDWFNGFREDLGYMNIPVFEEIDIYVDSFPYDEHIISENISSDGKLWMSLGDTYIFNIHYKSNVYSLKFYLPLEKGEHSYLCPYIQYLGEAWGVINDLKSITGWLPCQDKKYMLSKGYNYNVKIPNIYWGNVGTPGGFFLALGFRENATVFFKLDNGDVLTSSSNGMFYGRNIGDFIPSEQYIHDEIDIIYDVDDIEISDDNFQNDEKEKVEIYVPIPNEIVTYNPETGLDIDFDTEISIEEFTELMTPYVGSTWEDIQQDKPIPSKVPTDVPYPDDPVVPDTVVPPAPVPDEDDLPPDADEGDDPFTGADEGKTIDWDPLKGIGLHKKFPFCVPWDLYDSFKTFNVEGEAPCWKVEFLHDTEFTIDFSIFEPWAVIVRWGILILFNLGLILVTRNLIRG